MKGVHECKHTYTESNFLLLIQEEKPILQSHYVKSCIFHFGAHLDLLI